VAQEYSEDKAKGILISDSPSNYLTGFLAGGSLGWMTRGSMVNIISAFIETH